MKTIRRLFRYLFGIPNFTIVAITGAILFICINSVALISTNDMTGIAFIGVLIKAIPAVIVFVLMWKILLLMEDGAHYFVCKIEELLFDKKK